MLNLIKKNRYFFIPYLIFFVIASIALLMYSKRDIHLFINSFNSEACDYFFKYATHIGDGIVIGVCIFVLLFIKYRYGIALLFSTLSITIVVQSFKRYILPDMPRPSIFFDKKEVLHFVEGVDLNIAHSFPSGHTATAFTMFIFIAFISKNNFVKFGCFLLALTIGYSRVYLSQHFLNDIYFGSMFAVIITSLFYLWVKNWKNPKLDSSLLKPKSKNE